MSKNVRTALFKQRLLFVIAPNQKQPKYLPVVECITKLWYSHSVILNIKNDQMIVKQGNIMNLANMMLKERNQTQMSMLSDSTYKSFKNRQNLSMVIKVRLMMIFLELVTKETREDPPGTAKVLILVLDGDYTDTFIL